MTGFKPAEPDNWEDGRVYNTDDGNTYQCDDAVAAGWHVEAARIFVVILIGASEIWTRHTGPVPACPGR